MELKKIIDFLKNKDFDELIYQLNQELAKDSNNPMYYYYRFLAINKDYALMVFDHLADEVDLNRAIELEEEYSYEEEFQFFQMLPKYERCLFAGALRLNSEAVEIFDHTRIRHKALLNPKALKQLNYYVSGIKDPEVLRLTLRILDIYTKDFFDFTKEEKLCLEELNLLKEHMGKRIALLDEVQFDTQRAKYSGKEITIPNIVDTITPEILNQGVLDSLEVEAIVLSEGIKKIEKDAFSKFKNLVRIVLPRSLIKIEDFAFSSCYKLTEIYNLSPLKLTLGEDLNGGVAKYAKVIHKKAYDPSILVRTSTDYLFAKIGNLAYLIAYFGKDIDLALPDSFSYEDSEVFDYKINKYAFYGENIRSIVLSNNVKAIGSYAFKECKRLEEIKMSRRLNEVGVEAFANAASLRRVQFYDGVEFIMDAAFFGCNSLEEVILPKRITRIKARCFFACRALRSIIIPDNVEVIEEHAFSNCVSLVEVSLGLKVTEICWQAFSVCSLLTTINFPSKVGAIEKEAFYKCPRLKKVVLPKSLLIVGPNVFGKGTIVYIKQKKPLFGLPKYFDHDWVLDPNDVVWNYQG